MFIFKRIFIPLTVSATIYMKPSAAHASRSPLFPSNFIAEASVLNEQDRIKATSDMKANLYDRMPRITHDFIKECTNEELLHELSYIYVIYKPPVKPDQKIRIRNNILRLLKKQNTFTENELALLEYTLVYYGCYTS